MKMKNVRVEYIDGVKYTTYTKELKPKKEEKTFSSACGSKYSVSNVGHQKAATGKNRLV
jgi:hypothetical protein